MKKVALFYITISFLLVSSCAKKEVAPSGRAYVLIAKYQKGKSYYYSASMNMKNTMEMGGMSPTVNILSDLKYTLKVKDQKGDTLFMELKVDDINMSMKTAAGMKNVPDINNLKGRVIDFAVLKNGTVVKNEKDNALSNDELKSIVKSSSRMLSFLPKTPVHINEMWYDSTDKGVFNYVLKDVKVVGGDTIAVIGMKFKINETKKQNKNGMKITSNLKGEGDGKIRFSITRGILLDATSSTGLEGKAHMEGGMAGSGMDMPIYVDQTSETKFLKEE